MARSENVIPFLFTTGGNGQVWTWCAPICELNLGFLPTLCFCLVFQQLQTQLCHVMHSSRSNPTFEKANQDLLWNLASRLDREMVGLHQS